MEADDVDWGRYLDVESRATSGSGRQFTALGDPSRWGGQVEQSLPAIGGYVSGQLLRVQTEDPYSRVWLLSGTVSAQSDLWDLLMTEWFVYLELTMGVGQNTVIQRLNLRSLIALAAPWYGEVSSGSDLVRPWYVSGAAIGRAWSARVIQVLTVEPPLNSRVITSALTTPLAAGSGI